MYIRSQPPPWAKENIPYLIARPWGTVPSRIHSPVSVAFWRLLRDLTERTIRAVPLSRLLTRTLSAYLNGLLRDLTERTIRAISFPLDSGLSTSHPLLALIDATQ
jgi:hypothetical protein|nr:hypothetical protein Q903MT_gene4905 [Picea sitchensis]